MQKDKWHFIDLISKVNKVGEMLEHLDKLNTRSITLGEA